MSNIILYHGSDNIINKPELNKGRVNNDYGRGLYCSEDIELAKEWACQKNKNGYVNKYNLDTSNLKILDLRSEQYSVLNWIAILLKNRTLTAVDEVADAAVKYLLDNYYIDTTKYDLVIGYRADDSYFSYAQSFVTNSLSLRALEEAMKLGNLGIQVVLVSNKAFSKLKYVDSTFVDKKEYYVKYMNRDSKARDDYFNSVKSLSNIKSDVFIIDIIREGMK